MGTADPPAAVVQRLQEEHLRKDVIGFGSLGEALTAQGGRAEEASKAFDDALACCPAGVPPHLQRAYAHYCGAYASLCEERGDRQRAQELYERGLSVHPTCPTCLGNLPLFLQSCKRPSHEIEATYKAYFAEYPESVPVLVKYANFLRHALRAPDRAETILKKAIGISEDADALGAYAVLLHAVRPHDPLTEQLYGRAVKADPTAVNALSNYGLYLSEMKRDYAKAKKIYEQALTADPAHANSCYNYAVMLDSGLNDVEGAVELYERALKAKPTHAYALYNLAVVCEEKLNDHERAGSLYERAVAAAPRDSLAVADHGRFEARRGADSNDAARVEKGAALLRRALELDPGCATGHAALGEIALNAGDEASAKRCYKDAKASDPHASSVRRLGDLLKRRKM